MTWLDAPDPLMLSREAVHVWSVSLNAASWKLRELHETLAQDERERAERFKFDRHRNRFIAARGQLRAILARYLDSDPARLEFGYREHGKPFLASNHGGDLLCFNVSHSQDQALIAVTSGREVGVDIEKIQDRVDEDKIAERFFSPREAAALAALPSEIRRRAFHDCWTRKEAYIKARGEGLFHALDQFEVSIDPSLPFTLLSIQGSEEEAARWSTWALHPKEGFTGALAVEGRELELRCWRWNE